MKKIIGVLIMAISILGGLYVSGWLMFIKPIIEACKAFDTGTLTGLMIGITVLKCILASTVGGLIAYAGSMIGMTLTID